ncbi:MAG: hypothetical protein ACFFG0_53315, partial [Candidatus Thorarchaeota archaeon]
MEKKTSHSDNYDPAFLEKMLFKVSKRWIAGHSNIEAIRQARKSNKCGMSAILNYLGEGYTEKSEVDRSVLEYFTLIDLLKSNNIIGSISVKPTQVGLCIGYDLYLQNFGKISQKAMENGF